MRAIAGAMVLLVLLGAPAGADDYAEVGVGVTAPGGSTPAGSGSGGGGSGGGGAGSGGGGPGSSGSSGGEVPTNPFAGCTFPPFGFGQMVCPEDEGGLAGPVVPARPSAEQMAQTIRETIPVRIPRPSTSPTGVAQITGLRTWFWLDPEAWRPVRVRAELPGIWAEVTATPVTATWTPGDGGSPVVCDGPGARHPGTSGARTSCGHTFTTVGEYTITVEVTYEVTWRSSTGESGTQPALTLDTTLDVSVTQRQAVTT